MNEVSVDSLLSRELDPLFLSPERTQVASAWWAHVPFAFWIVAACRPRLFVELGTHGGVSYAAFCEAVMRARLETRCYAIDTWAGDPHAHVYGEEVYQELRAFHDARYAAFSELVRATFDDALAHFEDGSIDLLHIDGYHTYDSVQHDFETWRPKLSDRGVVIFHDTNVRESDFGVWRFFGETSKQFPSFEFLHGHGLGVLAVGAAVPPEVARLCALDRLSDVARLRERFSQLGARWAATTSQTLMVDALRGRLDGAEASLRLNQEAQIAQVRAAQSEAERVIADAERRTREAMAEASRLAAASEARVGEANRTLARVEEANRSLVVLRGRAATNEARLERELQDAQAALHQLRIDHEAEIAPVRQEIAALRNSTIWRASTPLRAVAGGVPSSVRSMLRVSLRSIYWVITPWATPRRIRFLRERSRQRKEMADAVSRPSDPVTPGADTGATHPGPQPPGGAVVHPRAADSRPSGHGTELPTRDAIGVAPGATPEPAVATNRLSLLFVSGEPRTPGHQYRVMRYVEAAEANGCTVAWMGGDELAHRFGELFQADVLVIWRMSWDDQVGAAVEVMRSRGKQVVFDVDDLMVDPDLAQVSIIDGIRSQFLAEDAVRGHYAAIRDTMMAADLCFAATEELALHMRVAGKVVHVLRNGFDDATHDRSRQVARRWRRERTDKLVRIGYACGSRTHQRDLGVAIEAIARLLRENSSCRLVLFRTADGATPVIDIGEYPALIGLDDRIEWRALRPLTELPEEIARFDINLAPLEFGNPFCEAKSELKFFEAALVGVPTIASPTGPYRRAIEHGRTGFLAASADDWYTYARQLVGDPALRDRVGREAYHAALAQSGSVARASHFGRVLEQLRGGVAAARAFALDAQLAIHETPALEVLPSETIFERDALGQAEVTVVVPLYNYESYVVEALDSVREQSLSPLDLVIVDDCSTNRSLAVATSWAEKNATRFNRILVLKNRANYGLALCRNAGFAAADTRYILPLDADNRLLPHCCERLLQTMQASHAAFVYGTLQCFGGDDTLLSGHPFVPQRFVGGNYVDAMALVSKEAWAIVGSYRTVAVAGWEDYDFWCRLAERSLRGEWHPETLALYRVHESSMLRTVTDISGNHRRLVEDFKSRHPWVSLIAQEKFRERRRPVASLTAPRDGTRLHSLLHILRCPQTHQKLAFNETGTALVSVDGLRSWPIVEGRPGPSAQLSNPEVRPLGHLSNVLPENALNLIRNTEGLVLNLSAGGSEVKFDHVVEVEFAIFRHTDVVGDAHQLPFDDETFEAIVVMNAFEHYRDPVQVAAELHRILKPGGRILIRTAFMQPLHERPWHFFNCTRYGLEEWFKEFDTEVLHVSENFCPNHSLAWLAAEAEAALRSDVSAASAEAFSAAPFGALAEMWRDPSKRTGPLWDNFHRLGQTTQEVTAAGFEFSGRKPLPETLMIGLRRRARPWRRWSSRSAHRGATP